MGRLLESLSNAFTSLFAKGKQAVPSPAPYKVESTPGVDSSVEVLRTPIRAVEQPALECALRREPGGIASTAGSWYIGQAWECFTLEDVERADPDPETRENEAKVPGRTAIPRGRYEIEITWSPRFKREMPRLKDVPGFVGVLVHWGNRAEDTEGCILVGRGRSEEFIRDSRVAFDSLFAKLSAAKARGQRIFLTVR